MFFNSTSRWKAVIVPLLVLLIVACSSFSVEKIEWPQLGTSDDPVNIDVSLLEASPQIANCSVLHPSTSPQRLPKDWLNHSTQSGEILPGIVMHHYGYMRVMEHYFNSGTYVYYLVNENEFYLWGDDWMGHFDGMVGPFSGDPTRELPQAISSVANPRLWFSLCQDR